jgi:quercetin dioxygenase-like cupin family protein
LYNASPYIKKLDIEAQDSNNENPLFADEQRRAYMTENAKGYSVADLEGMVEFAQDGIVSKTIVDEPHSKVVLFCMAAGQSLSEHTASVPATIHVTGGVGTIILDGNDVKGVPGTFVFMPKNQLHALKAEKDMVFVLHLMKSG